MKIRSRKGAIVTTSFIKKIEGMSLIAVIGIALLMFAAPHIAYADQLAATSMNTQASNPRGGEIDYTLGQEYTGSMGYTQGYTEKIMRFTIPESSHLTATMKSPYQPLKMVLYNSDGNIASADSNTVTTVNDAKTTYTSRHSCNLSAGSYYFLIGINYYSTQPITFIATAEPKITLGTVSISNVASIGAGKVKVSFTEEKDALGYETQVSTNTSFTAPKTVTGVMSPANLSGLNPGTTYARTRAYSSYNDGTKVYGNWSRIKAFTVPKLNNTLVVAGKTTKVSYSQVRKQNTTIERSKAITIKKAQGKVTYKKVSGNGKITVNKSTGKVTVKKGLAKNTYTVQAQVTAAGNSKYKKVTKTVIFRVTVK